MVKKMRPKILLSILILMTTSILPFASSEPPDAVVNLYISDLEPPEMTIEVSKDEIGHGSFTATVTVEKPPVVLVTVNLDGSCDRGWPTVVSPQTVPFTTSGSAEITVTVVVPQASPVVTGARVTVSGIATYPGGSTPAFSTAIINVAQYYRTFGNITPALGRDNPQEYTVTVRNGSNGPDTLTVSIVDESTHRGNDLSFSFSKTTTEELEMDGEEGLSLTVEYGLHAPSGEYEFFVRVTSVVSPNESYDCMGKIRIDHTSGRTGVVYAGIGGLITVIIILSVVGVAYKKGLLRRRRRA